MGTPEFAVPVLTALARTHEVVGALTRPDAVTPMPLSGRNRSFSALERNMTHRRLLWASFRVK